MIPYSLSFDKLDSSKKFKEMVMCVLKQDGEYIYKLRESYKKSFNKDLFMDKEMILIALENPKSAARVIQILNNSVDLPLPL